MTAAGQSSACLAVTFGWFSYALLLKLCISSTLSLVDTKLLLGLRSARCILVKWAALAASRLTSRSMPCTIVVASAQQQGSLSGNDCISWIRLQVCLSTCFHTRLLSRNTDLKACREAERCHCFSLCQGGASTLLGKSCDIYTGHRPARPPASSLRLPTF